MVKTMVKNKFDFLQRAQLIPSGETYKRLLIPTKEKVHIVKLEDIVYLTSKANYTHFIVNNEEVIISSKTIKVYDDYVTKHPDFMRIHKSYIINKNYAKTLHQRQRTLYVTMSTGNVLTVADSLKDALKEFLKY